MSDSISTYFITKLHDRGYEVKQVTTFTIQIFMSGDEDVISKACHEYCVEHGILSIATNTYIYPDEERGVVIRLINHSRFPNVEQKMIDQAMDMAHHLMVAADQDSLTVLTPDQTYFISRKNQ